MSKSIVYLLGAGASAGALPTIASMAERMRYFHILVQKALEKMGDTVGDYDQSRDVTYLKFLDQIKSFGTPDTVIRVDDIAASDQNNLKRMFLAAYIVFEQFEHCKEDDEWLFTQTEEEEAWKACFPQGTPQALPEYHSVQTDRRYIEFLSSVMKPREHIRALPSNLKFVSWNYDHQLEKALSLFVPNLLGSIQKQFKIAPRTDDNDSEWDQQKIEEEYGGATVIKLNGTAGFVPSNAGNSLFDPTIDCLKKQAWRKILNLLYSPTMPGAKKQKLMLAWDDSYKVVNECRRQAAEVIAGADVVVVIGYSFPNFNRWVDRNIFNDFDTVRSKLYIQDPSVDDIIPKLDGVKEGLRDVAIPVKSKGSFLLPDEFWE